MKIRQDDESGIGGIGQARGAGAAHHGHDTDAYNLRLLAGDARLRRLLRAYYLADEAGRARLALAAEDLLDSMGAIF